MWEVPAGSPAFDGYRLFYRVSGSGVFTPVDFQPSINSAVINVPNVSTNIYEFFLITYNNNPSSVSPESNHLETIRLNVSGSGTGIARLEWNRQSAQDQSYRVYRSDDNFTYTLLTTTSALEYNDTISRYCDTTTLYYRLVAGICNASSSIDSARFIDATTPEDPVFELVTVNNGFAEVTWKPSSSTDVIKYIIERGNPVDGFYVYDSVGNTTIYTDNDVSNPDYLGPCDNVVTYIVRAKDECGYGSGGDYIKLHHNILISGNTVELCDRKATIEWNGYINMVPPVEKYTLEKSINGGPFISVLDIPADAGNSYKALDPDLLESGVLVIYRIAASNSDNSHVSRSCELELLPEPKTVSNFNIDYVTVTDNSFITLQASSQPSDVPAKVEIYKADGDVLFLINTVPWNPAGSVQFEDQNVSVATANYDYQLIALDSCDFKIAISTIFNSILLKISITDEVNVGLDWSNHVGWGADLENYLVYKYSSGVLLPGYPKTISAGLTSYNEVDDATNSLQITYAVEAVKNDGKVSRSNEVLLPRSVEIDVPTAFRPTGVNKIFRPLIRNIDESNYLFVIYNRWGQQVFSTDDPHAGWDGTVKGQLQQGIYVYMVSYIDQTGVSGTKRGMVMLLD
ncbi:MAG: gliding motility-associated C-terminal domain-containing protein [Chloroflexota bacterium]